MNDFEGKIKELFTAFDESDLALNDKIKKEYDKALNAILDLITVFYAKYGDGDKLDKAKINKRANRDDVLAFNATIDEYIAQFENLTHAPSKAKTSDSKLQLLTAGIEFALWQATQSKENLLTEYLGEAVQTTRKSVGSDSLAQKQIDIINNEAFAGRTFSERVWGSNDRVVQSLKRVMTKAVVRGMDEKATVLQLQKLLNGTTRDTERLVRTETTRVVNRALIKSYMEQGVKRYMFTAVMDSHTSEICKSLDGETFNASDYEPGVNAPAMHPNCRSGIVPFIDYA